MRLLELEDIDLGTLGGVATFVRVDFNLPIQEGRVLDDERLRAALPTLRELRAAGARLLLASHQGRPKGTPRPEFSLRPAAARLAELLEAPVAFADDCVGEPVRRAVERLAPGDVCLLENLRFHAGEEANDPEFVARLAEPAAAYVGDAFGTVHRAHASVVGVAERIGRKAAGRLLAAEVRELGALLAAPARPFVAVVGGAKIAGKADTLENLLPRLDVLILGGAMANTFLVARGHSMGASMVESERIEMAAAILERAAASGIEVLLPVDLVATDRLDSPGRVEVVRPEAFPEELLAVDIGPESREAAARALANAGTVFWNGPLGVFEKPPFDAGSIAVAQAVADCPGRTVIGGGETVAAARRAGVLSRIGHVSTGGGASLELLAGKQLPGVAALEVER
jgi:phosphoglycerate kinase